MDRFVTIKTFSHNSELAVLRAQLESNGIECLVLDELTVQVNPVYSNAIGGIRLQVKESQVQKTIEILKEVGQNIDEDFYSSKNLSKLEYTTSRIPFLKNLRLEFRLIIIITISVSFILSIIYLLTLPTTLERLTEESWCVDKVTYDGKNYSTKTVEQIQLIGNGFCEESIDIRINRTIILPGFNSSAAWGKWSFDGNQLNIYQADTFDFVYNGLYKIEFSGNQLTLKSNQTTIHCHSQIIQINLPF